MTNKTLKLEGYMIVKVRKTITICLFLEDKDELTDFFTSNKDMFKGTELVPYFRDDENNGYIKRNDEFIRI